MRVIASEVAATSFVHSTAPLIPVRISSIASGIKAAQAIRNSTYEVCPNPIAGLTSSIL